MEDYYKKHKNCPVCKRRAIGEQTTAGYFASPGKEYKDQNRVYCGNVGCEWVGIIHELVEDPFDNPEIVKYNSLDSAIKGSEVWDSPIHSIRHIVSRGKKYILMGHINCEHCFYCNNGVDITDRDDVSYLTNLIKQ